MAYTKSNELQTRIALKYDSYLNWTTNNPVLLAGEIAIATIPVAAEGNNSASTGFTNLPNVVMKVGDGSSHYNDLKFVSALSADVYDWAKAAQKPSYDASEIANLQKFVEDHSDFDTNTEYNIVPVADAVYKYELKYKNIGDAEFKSYDTPVYIDLSDADTRLKKVEKDLAALIGGGEGGGISDMITESIGALDSEKTQTAGADGLALHIKQVDGVITEFSGSIAAETYDAHGAAAAAEQAAKEHAAGLIAQEVEDRNEAIAAEAKLRDEAIKALDYTAYVPGNAEGTVVSFVGTVSQADGVISAEKRDLVFNSAYHAETNKAATMADVTNAVADLNGAMHFEGVSSTDPVNDKVTIDGKPDYVAAAGDVVIYNTIEYVYDGSKWVQLGDESLAGTLIAALDLPRVNVGAAKTLSYIEQTDGTVAAEAVDIEIAQSQVTGLEDRLGAIEGSLGADGKLPKQVEANKQAIATINGEDAGKSMRTVATEEATAAVGALNLTDAAVEGEYVASVSQSNGAITVTRAKLPVIPALELEEGTPAAAAVEGEVTVIADIDVDGHKITDKRVNVVTKDFVNAAIGNLDATKDVSSTKKVMTGLVQEDGLVTSIKEVELADVAFSGNIADLKETENTYVVFNCGSSSVNV